MSTHAAAMLIAALAYLFARKNARNPRFAFGTGRVGDLAAFGCAIVLALVALLIGWESLVRLANPVAIRFQQALFVAVLSLAVNLVDRKSVVEGMRVSGRVDIGGCGILK